MFSRSKQPKIGVIGSVLVDIIATPAQSQKEDSEGNVSINIGGCAYNICYNLRKLNCKVSLFSVLKDESILTPFILNKLKQEKINHSFVFLDKTVPEGLFVSHAENKSSSKAVTSTCIDKAQLNFEKIRTFISKNDIIACDLGLSSAQLSTIIKICDKKGKKLICNGTSDGRINRITALDEGQKLYAIIMNSSQALTILPNFENLLEEEKYEEILLTSRAKNVIVTKSDKGMIRIDEAGECKRFPASTAPTVVTTIGAGDALTACVATASAGNNSDSFLGQNSSTRFSSKFNQIMPDVLAEEGATKGSDALFDHGVVTMGYGRKKSHKVLGIDRDVWMVSGILLAVIGLVITAITVF